MSSTTVAEVARLRDPHQRRTRTCRRVFTAAAQLLDESAEADVSLPTLAARARLTPSALFAHFPSVDSMFAELYLHRVSVLPLTIDRAAAPPGRVSEQLRAIMIVIADEPNLATACTRALLRSDDPAVGDIRAKVAAEVRRRIAAALGTGAWPEVMTTLETVFWGALMQVESRSISYRRMAERLDTMLALVVPDLEQ